MNKEAIRSALETALLAYKEGGPFSFQMDTGNDRLVLQIKPIQEKEVDKEIYRYLHHKEIPLRTISPTTGKFMTVLPRYIKEGQIYSYEGVWLQSATDAKEAEDAINYYEVGAFIIDRPKVNTQ
jgi:hypothetical protein